VADSAYDNLDRNWDGIAPAREKMVTLFHELIEHTGFGALRVDVRVLKRGYKEVVVCCGKEYRFVLKPGGDGAGATSQEGGGAM
jgi:hypothetical protein